MLKIGDFELNKNKENFLGRGSFSEVYKGIYIGINTKYIKYKDHVAIKIINTHKMNYKSLEIIEDEINIMNMIKYNPHPNIVECYDVIRKQNSIYIIMEFCDSGDLRTLLRKPIKELYTQFFFSQLVNGLKFLDKHNIVHRDIKPRNILLTNQRRVLKIADFGFAKRSNEASLYDTICGSPMYMAPEIMNKNKYNKQTDLWSIGIMLYEMLFGFHPYKSCKSYNEIKSKNNENVEIEIPPKNTKNKISNECKSLLTKLLQKDAKKRITWKDFFNHPWLNIYQYIIPKTGNKNEDYEKQIRSMSIGSLKNRTMPKTPDRFILSNKSSNQSTNQSTAKSNIKPAVKFNGKFEIIEDYCSDMSLYKNTNSINSSNNSNSSNNFNDTNNDTNNDANNEYNYEDSDMMFNMELDNEDNSKDCKDGKDNKDNSQNDCNDVYTTSIIDKSTILDSFDEYSKHYEIMDSKNSKFNL